MVSKQLVIAKRRSDDALKSTENLATKTGTKQTQNGAVKKNETAANEVKADKSPLPILEETNKLSLKDELRDQFVELQEFFYLHPQGAEDRLTYQKQTARKKKGDEALDKLQMIRRIEHALQDDVQEISTYEFFGFNDSLAPNTTTEVACSISLVVFHNDKMLKKETLFSGHLPCNVKRTEQKSKIVYHPVAKCFQDRATHGFLVAEVSVEYATTGSQSQGARGTGGRKRTTMPSAANVGLEKRTFYGSRKVYERSKSDGCLDIKFCDSAIHMSADTTMPTNWDSSHNCVSALAVKLEADSKCLTLPLIAFELTDQHCDLDWDEIHQRLQWRKGRKSVESGKSQRYIIYKKPSSSSSSVSSVSSTSDCSKENLGLTSATPVLIDDKMEIDAEFEAEVELAQMVENRCPFCLSDADSNEDLINHLTTRYPFDFRKTDSNIIQVGPLNSVADLSESNCDSGFRAALEQPKVITNDKVGILPNELLPIVMPDITPNPYPTYNQDCVWVDHSSTWKEIYAMREMDEFIDNTADEIRFMTWVNKHTLKTREPLLGQHQKAHFMKFLADELIADKPIPVEKSCTMLAAMTHSLLRANAIPVYVFNEILDYIFDVVRS